MFFTIFGGYSTELHSLTVAIVWEYVYTKEKKKDYERNIVKIQTLKHALQGQQPDLFYSLLDLLHLDHVQHIVVVQ